MVGLTYVNALTGKEFVMKLRPEKIEQIRLKFEALYLSSRKTGQGELTSKNLGDNFDEIITRQGYGYKYGHPDSAWKFFKLGFLSFSGKELHTKATTDTGTTKQENEK